jgi:hypothetical protein
MNQVNHQKTYIKTEEITSNNRDTNNKTIEVCVYKASPGERTQRHAPETAPLQQSE